MTRTIIPTKTIETVYGGPFHATLKRWEHAQGCLPTYVIETFDGWNLLDRKEMRHVVAIDVAATVEDMRQQLAIMVAKRAFGMPQHTLIYNAVVDEYVTIK